MERISKEICFMEIAKVLSYRSTCLRRKNGTVLVKEGRIIGTGYNGAPRGIPHCEKCVRREKGIASGKFQELCRGAHSELNAIINAALGNSSPDGGIIYSICSPCAYCAKAIVNAQITEVVYLEQYPDKLASEMLQEGGIICRKLFMIEKLGMITGLKF